MNILLVGSSGRMGGMVASVAASEGETIVAGVDTRPVPCPFPVYTDYRINETADVLSGRAPRKGNGKKNPRVQNGKLFRGDQPHGTIGKRGGANFGRRV